jgi:hypothetical protein
MKNSKDKAYQHIVKNMEEGDEQQVEKTLSNNSFMLRYVPTEGEYAGISLFFLAASNIGKNSSASAFVKLFLKYGADISLFFTREGKEYSASVGEPLLLVKVIEHAASEYKIDLATRNQAELQQWLALQREKNKDLVKKKKHIVKVATSVKSETQRRQVWGFRSGGWSPIRQPQATPVAQSPKSPPRRELAPGTR